MNCAVVVSMIIVRAIPEFEIKMDSGQHLIEALKVEKKSLTTLRLFFGIYQCGTVEFFLIDLTCPQSQHLNINKMCDGFRNASTRAFK